VGLLEGQLVINPTVADQKKSLMNIIIAGTGRSHRHGGIRRARSLRRSCRRRPRIRPRANQEIVAAIKDLHAQLKPKRSCPAASVRSSIYKELQKKYGDRLHDAVNTEKHPKKESYHLIDALKEESSRPFPMSPRRNGREAHAHQARL